MTKPIAPVKPDDGKPADIKEFVPTNKGMDDMNFTPAQIEAREHADAADKIRVENEAADKAKDLLDDGKPPVEPKKTDEDDFNLPPNDGFGLDDPLKMGKDEDPPAKVEPKKPEEVGDKKEQNAAFRQQIESANDRAKESDGKLASALAQIEDYKTQITESQTKTKEIQDKLSFQDPSEHPKVQELLAPWDRDLDALSQQISLNGGQGAKLKVEAKELIQQFKGLGDQMSEGFEERRDALIGKIDENYPGDRKEIIAMMSKGASVFGEAENMMRDIRDNGGKFQAEEARSFYNTICDEYKDVEKHFFNPSQELRDSDPANARVIMADIAENNPAVKDRMDTIKKFSRFGLNPLPPVDDTELRGMDDEAAAKYLEDRRVQHNTIGRTIRETYAESRMALTLVPVLAEKISKYEKIIEDMKKATPIPKDEDGKPIPQKDEPTDAEKAAGIKGFDPGPVNVNLDG